MIKLKPRTRIILLSVISILIVVTIVLGITYSFMQANIESSSVTEVSLSSCANITLTDTGESINLSNSYPMSKTRALETTPYTLTITSSCEDGSGYNLYLATLNTNTLSDSSIHYIITEHGNKNVITEGILSEATNGVSDFQDYELNELNNGINGTYGSIYRLYSSGINYNTEVTYDLYLYIDESVTNETMGQTFSAGLAVKASDYDFATVDEVTVTETTTDSITVSVSASGGTNTIQTYYYSINNGSYTSSNTNTYTFSGLSAGTSYSIRVYVTDTTGVESNVYTINAETENVVYLCSTGTNLATCIRSQYTSQGSNGIYYHTSSLANSAADNSYRYSGANPNNYVCFGSDATSCPSDSLYRIIGVFGSEVKLIKWDYANSDLLGTGGAYSTSTYSSSIFNNYDGNHSTVNRYYWNSQVSSRGRERTIDPGDTGNPGDTEPSNIWSESNLNTVNLNTNYLNSLGTTWQNKIATHSWKVGEVTYDNVHNGTPRTVYNYEVGSNSSSTTYSAKIGLMYVSDYGYAMSPDYWNSEITNVDNWMYMGLDEWTIRSSDRSNSAFYVYNYNGSVSDNNVHDSSYYSGDYAVRPVFYLNSNVTYVSGTGTQSDPIRIS